jgi:bacteriocin-like protein
MFELNEKNLQEVSGGWGFTKIVTVTQKNFLDLDLSHIYVSKGSSLGLTIIQNIA